MSRSTAKRGAVVKTAAGKTRITIRLDNAVPTWFRDQAYAAGGGSYRCVPKIVSLPLGMAASAAASRTKRSTHRISARKAY